MFICWQDILISRQLDTRIFIWSKIVKSHSILVELFRINNFKLLVRFTPLELTSGRNLTRLIYLSYAYSLDSYGAPNFTEKSITHIDIS